ncbi:MAG: SRPBCC family protein, partial [Bacteroidota bacterium]
MQSVKTEITIQADIQTVWKILEDFDNYHTWNHFCPKIETNKEIGGPFIMTVHLTPGKKPVISKEIFTDYEPPHVVGWTLDWGFLLKTHRLQILKK